MSRLEPPNREKAAVFSLPSSGGEGWGEEAFSSHTGLVWILISDLNVLSTEHSSRRLISKQGRCDWKRPPLPSPLLQRRGGRRLRPFRGSEVQAATFKDFPGRDVWGGW